VPCLFGLNCNKKPKEIVIDLFATRHIAHEGAVGAPAVPSWFFERVWDNKPCRNSASLSEEEQEMVSELVRLKL
jgi:hypothetical protein